jgi:hypothetical protein
VVARPCEVSWELAFSGIVCVAPLRLGGLRGKKSTPSVGWEVPVRSHAVGKWDLSWIPPVIGGNELNVLAIDSVVL